MYNVRFLVGSETERWSYLCGVYPIAWRKICGSFSMNGAKITYFLSTACNIFTTFIVRKDNETMNTTMKTKSYTTITTLAVCGGLLAATSLRAETIATATAQSLNATQPGTYSLETVVFSDSKEAGMMISAYDILASSDHDYGGHRVKAMRQVEAAAKSLGVNLHGDDHDRQHQVVSDEKMQSAANMLSRVLENAEVKGQPRISKHIADAIDQINRGLAKK
jgi:hypothetical protein